MGATTEYVYKLGAVQDSRQLQAEVERLRAENKRLTDQLQRSQAEAKRLQEQLSTEITEVELTGRGLELPQDRLTFRVEQFKQYRAEFKGKGGVYAFYHEAEGYLYIGVSADLGKRLGAHINGTKGGNKGLYQQLQALSGVTVTVYLEPNSGKRELYESYLILRYSPLCNRDKVSKEHDGYNVTYPQEVQDKIVRMYNEGKTVAEIAEATGVPWWSVYVVLNANGVERDRAQQIHDTTRERNEAIIQEVLKGDKAQGQIAKEYGVSQAYVSQVKTDYLKSTGQYVLVSERKRAILQEVLKGAKTQEQIAKEYGVSQRTVSQIKAVYLKATGQYVNTAERNKRIIKLYLNKDTNGLTNHHIAEAVGCGLSSVEKVIKAYRRQQRAQQAGTN